MGGGPSYFCSNPPQKTPLLLRRFSAADRLQLHTGQEAFGRSVGVVAQLGRVDGAGLLGVDDGGGLEVLGPLAWLELQVRLVVAPGAVRHGHDGLPAAVQTLTQRLEGHVLNEVAVRVVEQG